MRNIEWHSLPPKEETGELLQGLLKALKETLGDNLVSVILYGSVARGDATPDSDIDIFIVCQKLPPSQFERGRLFQAAVNKLRTRLDKLAQRGYAPQWTPILRTVEEAKYHSPLYLDMVCEAKILYDLNNFFKNVLDKLKARLEELGAKRVYLSDGSWYWDLKPDYKFGEVFEI